MADEKRVAQLRLSPIEKSAPSQTTLNTANVVRHLLWHKAMTQHGDDGSKLTEYIEMVTGKRDGEHVALKDDFHRDLAIAFELVIQHHLDPWDIDLSKFAQTYLAEAKTRGVDIVTAGRIILLAWTVLKLQSDDVADRAVLASQAEETPGWEDIADFGFSDEQVDYNSRIAALPRAPIDEKVRHKGDRRVTLMELIGALEEVHGESQQRLELNEQRLSARLALRRRMRGRLGDMMHREDVAAEMAETWARILDYPSTPVPFSALHEEERSDLVQTFTSLLSLTKEGRITVSQEEFPRGEIWITPKLAEAASLIAEEVKA